MSCLGGTPESPRSWVRHWPDGRVERVDGRICSRTNPRTSRAKCSGCPAFRGLRWDGTVANGLGTDGSTPVGLTIDESTRYEDALLAFELEDDDSVLFAWYARQDRELITNPDGSHVVYPGIGERTLRMIGDPDAAARWAEQMRKWRAAHPGADKRKRSRAAYMRSYRARTVTRSDRLSEDSQTMALSDLTGIGAEGGLEHG